MRTNEPHARTHVPLFTSITFLVNIWRFNHINGVEVTKIGEVTELGPIYLTYLLCLVL